MHAVSPKGEECFGGSCILIPTVTTFHNIRQKPTKVSVQAAKNYKSVLAYFLASYPFLTT